ncbi:MAG: hypothetical protein L6R19_01095 [Alphaproteobacteria bacterium]|nr:hypothetical protein [Alphaproteobacteria bacterium]
MNRADVATDREKRRVVLTDSPVRRVSGKRVTTRLGAKEIGRPPPTGSPITFLAVREEMYRRLRSSGGRPSLEGTEQRKMPIADEDWRIAERLAQEISATGFHPSAGQVMSAVLSLAMRQVDAPTAGAIKRKIKPA